MNESVSNPFSSKNIEKRSTKKLETPIDQSENSISEKYLSDNSDNLLNEQENEHNKNEAKDQKTKYSESDVNCRSQYSVKNSSMILTDPSKSEIDPLFIHYFETNNYELEQLFDKSSCELLKMKIEKDVKASYIESLKKYCPSLLENHYHVQKDAVLGGNWRFQITSGTPTSQISQEKELLLLRIQQVQQDLTILKQRRESLSQKLKDIQKINEDDKMKLNSHDSN